VRAAFLLALAACDHVTSSEGTWVPVDEIDGELVPEVGPTPQAIAAPAVLRVASYNILFKSDWDTTVREISESPELAKADIILAQEVENRDDHPTSRARMIGEALGMTWVFAPARIARGQQHGTAIFSRFPITNARVMKLPLGTSSWNQDTRNATIADIDLGGRMLTVVSIHLDVRLGPIDRIQQLHPVVTQVPDEVLIGGDYNTNPWAWAGTVPLTSTEAIVGQDQAAVIDDYMSGLGFGIPIGPYESTFNVPALDYMRLDNIYYRGCEITGKAVVHDVEGSDHRPVWIDVQL
jgi:endonuclease/exonuclease/phosphatase family metal-dependent hydrolase